MHRFVHRAAPLLAGLTLLAVGSARAQTVLHAPDGREVARIGNAPQPDLSAYRSPLETKIIDRRWYTNEGMYLANEEYYSGIPFFQRWIQAQLPFPSDPAFGWITNREAYWYSRYVLSNVFAQSHLGISMIHGPYWTLKAHELSRKNRLQRDRGERVWANKDVLLGFYLPLYYQRTGWPRVFDDASPTYLQYASGDPHFSGPIIVEDDFDDPQSDKKGGWGVPRYFLDWRSTRWDHDDMEIVLDLGGIAQTVKKQLLWADYFLGSDHQGPSPSDPSVQVILLGHDAEEGFRGIMLTLAAFNSLLEAKASLFMDEAGRLGGLNPLAYDPAGGLRYLPHRIVPSVVFLGDLPERVWALDKVSDRSSRLWDQASWLWATSEYESVAAHLRRRVFTDNPPVDGGIIESRTVRVARGLSKVLLANLEAMHWRSGTLVSRWTPAAGTGSELSVRDAALSIVSLGDFLALRGQEGSDSTESGRARRLLSGTAEFLLRHQEATGAFHAAYDVTTGEGLGGTDESTPQWFAIRALVAAYRATGDSRYLDAARRTWDCLQRDFYDEATGLYRSRLGGATAVLTPLDVAAAMGAMRELILTSSPEIAERMGARYTRWFVQAVDNSGFQMSEDDDTGELSYGVKSPDEDGDGIPFLKYGDGRYGIAPLPAARVVVNLGGRHDVAFRDIRGKEYRRDRFGPVPQAYVPARGESATVLFFPGGANERAGRRPVAERGPQP
ncbi:MAG: hypothetical protein ACE5HQ_04065 [Gemmatimonadota bacterium]